MKHTRYDGGTWLARCAQALRPPGAGLPALFAFTDPDRTPDPVRLAESLPRGAGLVLRTFGRSDLAAMATPIARVAQVRSLTFLIAADPELALRTGAAGVHWPQARMGQAWRWRTRFSVMSASAHDPMALHRACGLVDLAFMSPIFASRSPSAGRPMGIFRAAAFARHAGLPVYGLGGVNARTCLRLRGLGIAGVAAIDGLSR